MKCLFEETKINEKEAGDGPFKNTNGRIRRQVLMPEPALTIFMQKYAIKTAIKMLTLLKDGVIKSF